MHQSTRKVISSHQSGNVLFIILIGAALFAALSFAVMSPSSIIGNNVSQESNEILANQLIEQANAFRTEYKRLRLRSCNLAEIDLGEIPTSSSRRNPQAPSAGGDYSCSLFHFEGGGIVATGVPTKIFEKGASPLEWRHSSSLRVSGVGLEDQFELSLVIQGLISEDVCKVINQKLLGTENIPVLNTNLDIRVYDGTFPTSGWDYLSDPIAFSRHMACIDVEYSGERKNAFYVVLEAR